MIEINDLLSRKDLVCEISRDKTVLSIAKQSHPEFVIYLYGDFDLSKSPTANLTKISVPGFTVDDLYSGPEYSHIYEEILQGMLHGNYSYSLQVKNLWDRLIGGGIYFRVGDPQRPVIAESRCDHQLFMKKLYKQGALKSK